MKESLISIISFIILSGIIISILPENGRTKYAKYLVNTVTVLLCITAFSQIIPLLGTIFTTDSLEYSRESVTEDGEKVLEDSIEKYIYNKYELDADADITVGKDNTVEKLVIYCPSTDKKEEIKNGLYELTGLEIINVEQEK